MSRPSCFAKLKSALFILLLCSLAYVTVTFTNLQYLGTPFNTLFSMDNLSSLAGSYAKVFLVGFPYLKTRLHTLLDMEDLRFLANSLSWIILVAILLLLVMCFKLYHAIGYLPFFKKTSACIQDTQTGSSIDFYARRPAPKTTVRLRKQSTSRLTIRRNKELMSRVALLESSNTKLREAVDKLQIGHDGHNGQIERLEGRVDMILNTILDVEDLNEWLP
ncbi:MAG: hypothetical protein Q9176_005883 [Flavoplaca citrina]